jgi:hypothetical protein
LGEQITWVIDNLNAGTFDAEGVTAHVAPVLLEQAPAEQLAVTLLQIAGMGPFAIEPDSLVSTRDLPPTNARFTLAGQGGIRLAVTITVDRETGLITGLLFEPAEPRPQVTPVGTLREPAPNHESTPQASLPIAPEATAAIASSMEQHRLAPGRCAGMRRPVVAVTRHTPVPCPKDSSLLGMTI